MSAVGGGGGASGATVAVSLAEAAEVRSARQVSTQPGSAKLLSDLAAEMGVTTSDGAVHQSSRPQPWPGILSLHFPTQPPPSGLSGHEPPPPQLLSARVVLGPLLSQVVALSLMPTSQPGVHD